MSYEDGWAATPDETWKSRPVSILEAQIGYHPRDVKRVFLRSRHETPPDDPTGKPFEVVDAGSGRAVHAGTVERWGNKWLSWWWVLDFTPLRAEGKFIVRVGELESSAFRIAPAVFAGAQLDVVALDQIEDRIDLGPDDTQVTALTGHYTTAGVKIYRDCGSHYAELPPVGTVVHGLIDLHDHLRHRVSETDRRRIIDNIILGADYLVAAQQHTDDPNTDGRFKHSVLVNDPHPWAGDVYSYHDMVFAMAVLARAHRVVEPHDATRATSYLSTAVKAWTCATHRPHHLPEEWDLPPDCPEGDKKTIPFWTPQGFNHVFARHVYNIRDENWQMPPTLRTRDRLPFIWGAAVLYETTGEQRFLDSAVEFARSVADRQFTDWENPVDGAFGNFYEFEDRDDAFFIEFCQGGHWWMGNIESIDLDGFINLLRLAPDHPDAAAWYNVVKTYGEHYVKATAGLSPLGIYPVGCYRDEDCGGVKFFQNILCGATCLYGFAARTIMGIAGVLNDCSYQTLANNNVEFVAGLNPGIPNACEETAWDAQTLINGVGEKWFGGEHGLGKIPKGAVCNGFTAAEQFWIYSEFEMPLSKYPDAPRGIVKPDGTYHFNEDWIAHSHAYVAGVAKLEGPFVLKVRTSDEGRPVEADVVVSLTAVTEPHESQQYTYRTDVGGELTVTDLPPQMTGTVSLTAGEVTLTRQVQTVGSGRVVWDVDVARYVEVSIEAPERLPAGGTGQAVVTVTNPGRADVQAEIRLSASGVRLEESELTVPAGAGETCRQTVGLTVGERVMPYVIYARVHGATAEGPAVFQGLVEGHWGGLCGRPSA